MPARATTTDTVKSAVPWLITAAIVTWLFTSVDVNAVAAAFATADWRRFGLVLVGFTTLIFLVDSWTLTVLFRRLVTQVSYRDVLAIRGASFFLNAIHYGAANGAMAWFLRSMKGAPFLRGLSAFVWLNFLDVMALLALMSLGLLFGGGDLLGAYEDRLLWVLAAAWLVVAGALTYWLAGVDFLVLGRLRQWRIFEAFRRARPRDYATLLALRAGIVLLFALSQYSAAPAYSIEVPLLSMLVYHPVLTFVHAIPASVSGLGAYQVAMVALFSPHVVGAGDAAAQVVAYSTAMGPGLTGVRLVIGVFFVARIGRALMPTQAALEEARAEAGAPDDPAGD